MTSSELTAVVATSGDLDRWFPTLASLLALTEVAELLLVSEDDLPSELAADPRVRRLEGSFREAVGFATRSDRPILVVTHPAMVPALGVQPAVDLLEADIRNIAVGFLCNAAGHLSFPRRNEHVRSVQGHDETTLTRRLREQSMSLPPVPISVPSGPMTLLARDAVVTLDGMSKAFDDLPEVAVAEFVLRASRRGFRAVLDPTTYVARFWDKEAADKPVLQREEVRHRLHQLHPFFPRNMRMERLDDESALGIALRAQRALVKGLRVFIDGSWLGPVENGTQVQTLSLINALCERDDVEWVGVGLNGPIPSYGRKVLSHPKVKTVRFGPDLRIPAGVPNVDVIHRPYQPPARLPWAAWREVAPRVLVTIQDLISYAVGAYHDTPEAWSQYRRSIKRTAVAADGLVVISHDVAADLDRERLPVASDRVFVVENGTDHLRGDEPDEMPAELTARGWSARPFLLVLGANYSHKNRDLAVRAFERLREKHPSLGLVLAGVEVHQGSSRAAESRASLGVDYVATLPDVSSEERNWLLRHAEICFYPTSAEGFGLVPFEAAHFGTPIAAASFGPLAEVLDGVPGLAASWTPEALADCCDALLSDPALARDQMEAVLKRSDAYAWSRTAELLVTAYRDVLSRPVRRI